jgi:ribose-phosphate pyrophosphokinase
MDVLKFHIVWEFENEAELFHIAQLRDLIDSTTDQKVTVNLHVPFLPYGRQDKSIGNNNTFAIHTFFRILASLRLDTISTLDAHSEIGKVISIFPEKEIDTAFDATSPTLICFPDKGAKDRYGSFFGKFPSCSMTKERDQDTGYIKNLFLNELIEVEGQSVLIVDDICDGGMTFKLTAEKLLTLGAKEVNLYTTHGIYSKGLETLRESGISRIFNRNGEVSKSPTPPKDMIESELSNT